MKATWLTALSGINPNPYTLYNLINPWNLSILVPTWQSEFTKAVLFMFVATSTSDLLVAEPRDFMEPVLHKLWG